MGFKAFALLIMATVALGQREPTKDLCRRFGHQAAVVDQKLYIDGGQINWRSSTERPRTNFSNTFLGYHDLTKSPLGVDFPPLVANLSKNSSVPSVSGGQLWPDAVNKKFYLFGGEVSLAPSAPNLFSYDILNDQWESLGSPDKNIQSVSWAASVGVSTLGQGYSLGGYLNNATVPNWGSNQFATSQLIRYDMDARTWTNSSGPDGINGPGTAEGAMVYVPASNGGMLVHFGGVLVQANGTTSAKPMSTIHIYDIKSSIWYKQTATGPTAGGIPADRRKFCADAAWSADKSSYNIYLYGGQGFGTNVGYDDMWILSLPSFQWIPFYQSEASQAKPKHSLSCNIVNGGQMLIVGGQWPMDSETCDSGEIWAVHNADIGKVSTRPWEVYKTNITTYSVPPEVISAVGGSPLGQATNRSPKNGFENADLNVLFQKQAIIANRTATRAVPAATGAGNAAGGNGSRLPTGAIAGIAVGGAILITALILGLWFFMRQKRRKVSNRGVPPPISKDLPAYTQTPFSPTKYSDALPKAPEPPKQHYQLATTPEPVELYGSQGNHYQPVRQNSHNSHIPMRQESNSSLFGSMYPPSSRSPPPFDKPSPNPSTFSDGRTELSSSKSETYYGSPTSIVTPLHASLSQGRNSRPPDSYYSP
ncbi:hypothetical protein B0J14DRAFT_571231 [Halenospora varia]|nr:hypothetical protein B0J14DRAFT_571231 [Halenospora varia]